MSLNFFINLFYTLVGVLLYYSFFLLINIIILPGKKKTVRKNKTEEDNPYIKNHIKMIVHIEGYDDIYNSIN